MLGAVDSTLRVVRARWVSTGGEPLAGTRAGAPARVLVVERLRRATERHRRRAVRNSLGLAVALVSVYQGPGIPVWMCLSWWRARARFSALYCLLCPSVVLCISLHVQVRLNDGQKKTFYGIIDVYTRTPKRRGGLDPPVVILISIEYTD